jgi:hypothetical protein
MKESGYSIQASPFLDYSSDESKRPEEARILIQSRFLLVYSDVTSGLLMNTLDFQVHV